MQKQYRQGDVLVERVTKTKQNTVTVLPRESGRIILAHGEATGHAHVIADQGAVLSRDGAAVTTLEIKQAVAMLQHQEHATIELKRGTYQVIRQREYSPGAIRKVAD